MGGDEVSEGVTTIQQLHREEVSVSAVQVPSSASASSSSSSSSASINTAPPTSMLSGGGGGGGGHGLGPGSLSRKATKTVSTWRMVSQLQEDRVGCNSASLGSKIFVFGGEGVNSSSWNSFDTLTGQWASESLPLEMRQLPREVCVCVCVCVCVSI